MNRSELISKVAKNTGVNKDAVGEVVRGMCDVIMGEVIAGGKVSIYEFGRFDSVQRKGRVINGFDGKEIHVPPKRVVKFYPAKFVVSLARYFSK